MGCGEFIVKYVLFFANLFFALAGLTLLGLGVAIQLQVSAILDLVDGVELGPVGAMVVGGLVFLVAFFGCCGSLRESNCMLVTYACLMIVLMLLKIALATTIFVNLTTITDGIPVWLNQAFNQTNLEPFHQIESTFKCCGTTGPGAYGATLTLPATCCSSDICTIVNSYPGCNQVLIDFFNTFGLVIGIVLIGIVAVELVAVVFSLCLANHARNAHRRSRY